MLNPLKKAENAVKIVKRVMMKSVPDHSDLYLALLDLRNTSSRDIGCSPAQGIFERRTTTFLPVLGNVLRPRYAEKVKENLHYRKGRETQCYKKVARNCQNYMKEILYMCVLKEMRNHGEKVVVQGQVDIRANNISTEKGEYRRNRQHLSATAQGILFYTA